MVLFFTETHNLFLLLPNLVTFCAQIFGKCFSWRVKQCLDFGFYCFTLGMQKMKNTFTSKFQPEHCDGGKICFPLQACLKCDVWLLSIKATVAVVFCLFPEKTREK